MNYKNESTDRNSVPVERTLLTPQNQAHANVCVFGTSAVVLCPIGDDEWFESTVFRFRDSLAIPQWGHRVMQWTPETDMHWVMTHPDSDYKDCQVLFIRVLEEYLTDQAVEAFMREVHVARKARNLSTIVVVGRSPDAKDPSPSLSVLSAVSDVTVKKLDFFSGFLGWNDLIGLSGSPVSFFRHPKEFDTDDWENVGFLDIDGVLHSNRVFLRTGWYGTNSTDFAMDPIRHMQYFDQDFLHFLRKLSAMARIKWVLSSAWRIFWSQEDVVMFGKLLGLPFVGKTENFGARSDEIKKWIDNNPHPGKIVTIDDELYDVEGATHFGIDAANGPDWNQLSSLAAHFDCDIYDMTSSRKSHVIPYRLGVKVKA